jgi:hypothetical protein
MPKPAIEVTIQEVKECHKRLIEAGTMLPVQGSFLGEDYYTNTIERAAESVVVEGVLYWKAKDTPDLEGCVEEVKIEVNLNEDAPWWL